MENIRKAVAICIAVGASASLLISCFKDGDKALDQINASTADIRFVKAAAISNYTEVMLGKLDTAKALDVNVKAFGAMMITVHTTADSLLKTIANPLGLSTPDSLDNAHIALKVQLTALSGRAFDSVYIHSQVSDHQAAVDLYQAEIAGGQQGQLKLFASNHLPLLQDHLQAATALAANY